MEENQNIVPGTDNGKHVSGTPLTTTLTKEASPDLLLNSIDRRIVKVRPMSTPIDQLSRCAKSRPADNMIVEYYSVDTKRTESTVKTAVDASTVQMSDDGKLATVIVSTHNDNLYEPTETVLFPQVKGAGDYPLTGYVTARKDTGIAVTLVNPPVDATGQIQLPEITAGQKVVRMGRAASELDVQTAQFAALPQKRDNFCQIFKMQIEQSTLQKIADKEVSWTFTDQEEAAIIDMRLGMEKNFLFGARARFIDPVKNQEVYLTGGIWQQAGRDQSLNLNKLTETDLIGLCSTAFTQNAGSKQKILIAGTKLVEAISKLTFTRSLSAQETMVNWGIEFKEIRSNFGSLLVVHSEIFDQCGHERDGLIIDPAYVTKYVYQPFRVDKLDLRRSGQRNTDAVVITEASCLVLRYPDAHVRVNC